MLIYFCNRRLTYLTYIHTNIYNFFNIVLQAIFTCALCCQTSNLLKLLVQLTSTSWGKARTLAVVQFVKGG